MNNNKGFTLVELLAMLVVLGILMAISIPNITGIVSNNRLNVMRADATKMVDTAKLKFSRIDRDSRPTTGKCIVYALNYLNDSGDITDGPNGGQYMLFDSFVLISKETSGGRSKFEYYISLVEVKGAKRIGMTFTKRGDVSEGETEYIKEIPEGSPDLVGLGVEKSESLDKLNAHSKVKTICPNGVIDYYPGKILK